MESGVIESTVLKLYKKYSAPFLGTLISGLVSYMYAFTNKLVNYDELYYGFSKGAGLESGRWGLDILSHIFPNYSMTWLYGLLTVFFISISVCVIVETFEIKSNILKVALGAVIVTMVSTSSMMLFLYTSYCYAIALLFSALSVYFAKKATTGCVILSVTFNILMLSIYQAYISVTASLFVVLIIKNIIYGEYSIKQIVKYCILYLAILAISLVLYYSLTLLLLKITNTKFNELSEASVARWSSVISNIIYSYKLFVDCFKSHAFLMIPDDVSQVAHIICAFIALILMINAIQSKGKNCIIILLLAGMLFPLSVNGVFVILGDVNVNSMTMVGMLSIYVLGIILVDNGSVKLLKINSTDVIIVCLMAIISSNVIIANKSFLKQAMDYENTYAFFTTSMAQVSMTEGYDSNCKIAFVGWYNVPEYVNNFEGNVIRGAQELGNAYSRDLFIRQYIGIDVPLASKEEISIIEKDERVMKMQRYPYNGYVQKIDNYIVVKL